MIDLVFATQLDAFMNQHPYSITRWVSTTEHNRRVGGAPNSAHLSGNGVDLVFDSLDALKQGAKGAFNHGFTGIEVDLTNNHLHLDMKNRHWRVVHRGPGQESPLDAWLTAEV